jgi:hypothetical protein
LQIFLRSGDEVPIEYSARQQVRCARRLRKWHGNSGEVFAQQAVTPSQEQVKTPPTHQQTICGRAFFDSIGPQA